MMPCPCCSTLPFSACCEPYLLGALLPDTPEKLMRSRYTAYATGNIGYIARTMAGKALTNFNFEEAAAWSKQVTWRGLDILSSATMGDAGVVSFEAHFEENGVLKTLAEKSQFVRENGVWMYVNGDFQ